MANSKFMADGPQEIFQMNLMDGAQGVERSETKRSTCAFSAGFVSLYPSYEFIRTF
jgi:hypothetical protein